MNLLDRRHPEGDAASASESGIDRDVAALWSALEADRRSRDERTARLRAMRLSLGDDERA